MGNMGTLVKNKLSKERAFLPLDDKRGLHVFRELAGRLERSLSVAGIQLKRVWLIEQ